MSAGAFANVANLIQQNAPPPTDGRAGDLTSPVAMDLGPPQLPPQQQAPAPDLSASPQEQLGRLPQMAVPKPGGWSPENPMAQTAKDLLARYQSTAPSPNPTGGPMKRLLTNFLSGGGSALMNHVGLPTPDQQRQNLLIESHRAAQLASQWEENQSLIKTRAAQLSIQQQEQQQRNALFPGQLQQQGLVTQQEQFNLDQAKQNAPTAATSGIPLDADTAKIAGVPAKFIGQPLSQDDWRMVDARIQSKGYSRFDTGQDGPQGGIWLVDRSGNKLKQLTPVSESGRATAIAKMQLKAAEDANNPKAVNMAVGTSPEGTQIAGTPQELVAAGVKNITKLGQAEADKVNTARQLTSPNGLFALANAQLDQFKPGELEGLAPRWDEFMAGTVGAGDPRYVKLRTYVTGLLSTALMQAHVGSRGGEALMEHFQNLANTGKMNKDTLKAALSAEQQYVEEKAMRPKGALGAGFGGGNFFSQFGGKPR